MFNKYLQAARQVSEHMLLKPDGIDFAPHPMLAETDRDRYSINRILDFYAAQPTDVAAYFEAAWRYKHRAALGQRRASLADVAARGERQRQVPGDDLERSSRSRLNLANQKWALSRR